MKVMFVIKRMHQASGGAERVLADVMSGLASRGHEVMLITSDAAGQESFYSFDKKISWLRLGIGNTSGRSTIKDFIDRMRALRRIVNQRKPDIVIPFMHSSFVPVSLALTGSGIPVLASEHTVPQYYKGRPFEYALILLSFPFIKGMSVVSESVRKLYPAFLRKKIIVLPNVIAEHFFTSSRKKEDLGIVLNVGRLAAEKDQAILIDAFAILQDHHPLVEFRIVGDGILRPLLERHIAAHDLEGRVEIVSGCNDILAEYEEADLYVSSSRIESFGMAVAEAMACGLPVIGFGDCAGTRDLIEDQKNGIIVQNRSAHGLASAMADLLAKPDLRRKLGEYARESVRKYSAASVISEWEKEINILIKPH